MQPRCKLTHTPLRCAISNGLSTSQSWSDLPLTTTPPHHLPINNMSLFQFKFSHFHLNILFIRNSTPFQGWFKFSLYIQSVLCVCQRTSCPLSHSFSISRWFKGWLERFLCNLVGGEGGDQVGSSTLAGLCCKVAGLACSLYWDQCPPGLLR